MHSRYKNIDQHLQLLFFNKLFILDFQTSGSLRCRFWARWLYLQSFRGRALASHTSPLSHHHQPSLRSLPAEMELAQPHTQGHSHQDWVGSVSTATYDAFQSGISALDWEKQTGFFLHPTRSCSDSIIAMSNIKISIVTVSTLTSSKTCPRYYWFVQVKGLLGGPHTGFSPIQCGLLVSIGPPNTQTKSIVGIWQSKNKKLNDGELNQSIMRKKC